MKSMIKVKKINLFLSILIFIAGIFFFTGCSGGSGGGGDDTTATSPSESKIVVLLEDLNNSITDPLSKISFDVTSTYDIESFEIKINNVDRTELVSFDGKTLEIQPTTSAMLPFDYIIITLTLTDKEGFSYTQTFSFDPDFDLAIAAGFDAQPQIGYAPMEVTFSPKVSAEESIQLYHWDFGDGTKNDSNTSRENLIGSPVKHTYTQAGEYNVTLTIYDSAYQPASSTLRVKVYNEPPTITSITASPSNGDIPLTSYFSAYATDNEGIKAFLWDFNGDGIIDINDTKVDENTTYIPKSSSSYKNYTYENVGEFQAILTVVDITGESVEVKVPTISVLVGPVGTPTVNAYAYPSSGTAPLDVSFSAGYYMDKWEWDFDGDGVYDYSSTDSGSVDHIYDEAGTYYAQVRVTDNGFTSSDTVEIEVLQDISLSRSTDTIDVNSVESVELNISVAAKTDVKLIIEDRRYQEVVTLLDWQEKSGEFSVSWDGTDSDGVTLAEGDYYAVLLYKENGEIKRFDLRDERDNVDIAITTNISAGTVFAPYKEPMLIEFNLSEAAEVSLDIGPDGYVVTERIKTLLLKQPLGKGSYTIKWAGDANDGTLADLSVYKDKYPSYANYYMTGGFKNLLADNAVFVKSGVSILNLEVDTPVYVPNTIDEDKQYKELTISFDLSSDASVTLTINDAQTGATVMSKEYSSLIKGSQSITWDGKDEDGKYIAPGVYRIGVKATDTYGYTSLTQYVLQRIFY